MAEIYLALFVLLGVLAVIVYFVFSKNNAKVDKIMNILGPQPKEMKYTHDSKRVKALLKEMESLSIEEQLHLMRHMLGSSYRAGIKVSTHGISIEGLGSFIDIGEDVEKEDITG